MNTYYTIRSIDEECPCKYCGSPLDIGTRIYERNDEPFCTAKCADKHDLFMELAENTLETERK